MSTPDPQDHIRSGFTGMASPAPPATPSAWQPATPFERCAPLITPTQEELAFAFAANLFDLFRAMSHLPSAAIEEQAHLSRHIATPFNPMFKGIWRSRLEAHEVDDAISESIAWLKRHSVPFAFWWIDPGTTPADMGARLQAQGFAPWEEHAPGMAAELTALNYDLLTHGSAGYTQERVTDERGLRDFKAAERARLARLEALSKRAEQVWAQIPSLLAQRTASGYEQAVTHLAELRDLAVHRNERPAFDARLADVVAPYATSSALQRRLKEKRLA